MRLFPPPLVPRAWSNSPLVGNLCMERLWAILVLFLLWRGILRSWSIHQLLSLPIFLLAPISLELSSICHCFPRSPGSLLLSQIPPYLTINRVRKLSQQFRAGKCWLWSQHPAFQPYNQSAILHSQTVSWLEEAYSWHNSSRDWMSSKNKIVIVNNINKQLFCWTVIWYYVQYRALACLLWVLWMRRRSQGIKKNEKPR